MASGSGREPGSPCSSNSSSTNVVRIAASPVREVRYVFLKILKIHALKLLPGSKLENPFRAFRNVSCTRSSASLGLRASQWATLYSDGNRGSASSSNDER